MTLHTFDILARAFAQENSGTCFALMGDANMAFATRLSETGVRMIYVRHEHCAVAAAMAHARKSGEVGLATVTCGPGLTQLMTALPAAVRAGIPMVILAGEAPLKAAWYNQAIDQAPFVAATGAAYHQLHTPAAMPRAVRDAFLQARQEKRPVVLGVPFDLQELPWDGPETLPQPSRVLLAKPSPMPPHPDDLAKAVDTIAQAQKIIVMAGLGATHAVGTCRDLAQKCDGLLATTLPARGLFHDDPFSIGIAGGFSSDIARELFSAADLVIAVGCSLAQHNSDKGALWPEARVLHVDINPLTVAQGRVAADVHLRADARLGIEALTDALDQRPIAWRTEALAERIQSQPADGGPRQPEDGVHDPRDAVAALDAAILPDWQLVNSSGHCSYFFAQMPRRPFETFLTIREFGAIGNGISFAMGVATACPDSPVVLFDGDGSLLMHIQELETILRHELNIMIVVMNDGAYGSEIHKLRAEGLDDTGAVFGRTDLAAIARGFGADGVRLDDLGTLRDHVETFASSKRAMLVDIPVSDRIASPVIRRSHGSA